MTMTQRTTMTRRTTGPARLSSGLARIARRVAEVVAECDYAQRRSFAIMTNPDSYVIDRDQAPDTYAEFLFRTSGGLLDEPPCRPAATRPAPA